MLKGIKKIVAQDQHKKEQNVQQPKYTLNQTELKKQAIMQEEENDLHKSENINAQKHQEDQELQIYGQCYDLFIQGQVQELQQKLKRIRQQVNHSYQNKQPKIMRSSFEYNMDFDEDKDLNEKQKLKKRNKPIMASNRIIQYCPFCPDNQELQLISASNYVYLALPKQKTFKNYFHLILAPVDHQQTMIGLNQDILTQISNYKKCLIQAFDKKNMQVIFFQQFSKSNSHIYIECLAMNYAKAQDLPFFFKQGMQDIEGNWSTHKDVLKIEKQKGGIQRQIPKQIKYFYIDFSIGYGYAHIIEDQKNWKREFCYQILATALGMELHQVKTTQQFNNEEIQAKKQQFNKIWKQYDWTELI